MAELGTLVRTCIIILGTFNVLKASENNFNTISVSSRLIQKYDRHNVHVINADPQEGLFDSFPSSDKSLHIQKRQAENKGNITTKITRINDTHQQLMVRWVGSDVIICLAKSPRKNVPSSLYISYDYGDSFENKTEFFALNDSRKSYASLDKFYSHPAYINHIVFADVINSVIFTTRDSGKTFKKIKLAFSPSDVSFQEDDPFTFLAHDKATAFGGLWLTKDFGSSWTLIQQSVKSFYWSGSSTPLPSNVPNIVPMKGYTYRNDTGLLLFVERLEPSRKSTVLSSPNGKNNTVWMSDVDDFKLIGDFMFATTSVDKNNVDLHVSYRRGPFVKAVFPSELNRLGYQFLDVSEGQIFVAVSHTSTLCNLYTSQAMDDRHIFFALSLERILCFFPNSTWQGSWLTDVAEESFADFHKVEGLRGIYIASQVQTTADASNIGPEHLLTLITFDRGGEWRPLTPPPIDDDGLPIKCNANEGCSLHLSQKFNQLYPPTRSVPILSSESAPGIIMATGTIGKSLKGHPKVFLSRDGGLTWRQILKDYYFFNFGDHGGVFVAVKFYRSDVETRDLLYSTDEGEKFHVHEFHSENLRVYGLMTEPGGNTTVFTMFGSALGHHQWLIIKVDLRNVFSYNCTADDYKFWSPSSKSGPKMPCILGRKETYERRIAHSNCYNGKDYNRPIRTEICECDMEDFECDFGFERTMSLQQCIRNKTFEYNPYEVPATCRPGGFYNRTKGYAKIPGDVCIDGNERNYLPDTLPCPLREKKEFLLVAQRDKISRIDLKDASVEVLPVLNLKNVIAIEFDMRNNCVYWADITLDKIGRQCFNNGTSEPETLIQSNSSSIEGMALDWVSNNLYFVDGTKAEIEVIRTDVSHQGRMRRRILGKKDVKKPRGIAVHPMAGYLFWTDWEVAEPSVSRAYLNGSDIRRLFTKPVVEWPNGITIDHIAERIYWVDARQDYIASSDLDGKRFKKIIMDDESVSHPFAVAVFKDFVYWDDWKQSSIYVADKDHGVGIQALLKKIYGPMDLKVFAHSFQEGTNPCGNATTNKCSHLCFGGPGNTYSCLCPQDRVLIDGVCYCPDKKEPDEDGTCPSVGHTCAPNQFKCANDLCIPKNWRCDNEDDCKDNSDEVDCPVTSCANNMFTCSNGQCISKSWVCDFDMDCPDGGDEKNCTHAPCSEDDFRCKNGRCIHKQFKCDLEDDCKDNSDEEDCPVVATNITCKPEEFKCGTSCIPNSWRCDGDKDCNNNEDELNCETGVCESWQFQCKNKKCIFTSWTCDGDDDCGDMSDEHDCTHENGSSTPAPHPPVNSCNEWTFKCANGNCIPYWWKCDQVNDCKDMSDELGCSATDAVTKPSVPVTPHKNSSSTCAPHHFRCYTGECISDSWVCDGMNDCDLGEDEQNCRGEGKCAMNQFLCHGDGSCVFLKQVCDGKFDCPDKSDEFSCKSDKHLPTPASPSCEPGFFPCDASTCIPMTFVCDKHQTCYDGTDEADCDNFKPVYQILDMNVDHKSVNSSGFLLYWWISLPENVHFQFMPSIVEGLDKSSKNWRNKTWVEGSEYHFGHLKPYTTYTVTVYVRLMNTTEVFPPATFAVTTTLPGVPSPPRNVTVVQKSYMSAEVLWQAPKSPNGPISTYVISMTPPVPQLSKTVSGLVNRVLMKFDFEENREYTFWVTAKNDDLESNRSESVRLKFDSLAFMEHVQGLTVAGTGENSVTLSWKSVPGVDGYVVQPVPLYELSYPKIRPVNATNGTTSLTVENLAPHVNYKVEVRPYRNGYLGPESSVQAETKGVALPVVSGLRGEVVRGEGTAVRLSWTPPGYPSKVDWVYGIYHAVRMEDLLEDVPIRVANTSATLTNLAACESYLINVGLVGPRGIGPLAPPLTVTTSFNRNAPPKRLTVRPHPTDENSMVVEWESSCKTMTEAISYEVVVTEINLNKSSSLTLHPSNSSKFEHTFKTHYGGRYSIVVSTTANRSVPSMPVYYDAPEILPPHQVQVLTESNGSFIVLWRENQLPEEIQRSPYKYRVFVSEGSTLNLSSSRHFDADSSPFIFNGVKEGVIYSFAVQLVTDDGYASRMSEISSVTTPWGSLGEQMFLSSNLVSTTVPIVLLLVTLAGVLGFLVYRHRRLKRNSGNYANSHYDTRSGSTTFGGADALDDEDSPNIRGFSDDEPLVMA